MGKLTAGGRGARYYTRAVAQGREDYYAGTGEAPGEWIGSGWGREETDNEVSEGALRALLDGLHPSTEEPIRRQQARPTLGFDLTFSAPKSVSVLYGVGEAEVAMAVRDAHDTAVRDALGYLERSACRSRRGHAGKESVTASGFLAAAFRHRTSRAGDPQLHTHVVVANGVRGSDGRWGSLDSRRLYRHAKTAGYLYQAALRAQLTDRLGVDWTPTTKGSAELAGVPRTLIHHFSRRREEITTHLARRGQQSPAAAQIAALDTRRRKDYNAPVDRLRADWRARAEEHDFGPAQLAQLLDRTQRPDLSAVELARGAAKLAGAGGVTRENSTFDRRAVIQGWAELHRYGARAPDIEAHADGWLQRDDVIPLAASESGFDDPVFSTRDLLRIEAGLLASADRRQGSATAQGSHEAVDAAVERRPSIDPEQVDLVDRLVTSGDGVQVVRSAAGTGKTFALDAAREAWDACGIRVVGCALSARAAMELRDIAAIPSTTIASMKLAIDRGYGLAPNSVLVVDEAGMVGTRDLSSLVEHAENVGAKVVLVGDDRQLPEINAGGGLRALADRLGALELREVRRQAIPWDRAALSELRDGDIDKWADAYKRHDRVVGGPNAEVTRGALVDGWWRDVRDQPQRDSVMVALRRRDVADLNEKARGRMRASGALGSDEVVAGGRGYAVGDRVVTARNDRILDVANGERGRVVAVDAEARSVRVALANREVSLPSRYLDAESLQHGYAMTAHRLQGATVDRTHVLGSDELYREWGYTALSRHRDEAHFYVTDPEAQEPLPGLAERGSSDRDVLAPLHRERAKTIATDLVPQDTPPAAPRIGREELAARLASSMPDDVRALPAAERRRAQTQQELQSARTRLEATESELAAKRWPRGQTKRTLEQRATAQRAAVAHWQSELESVSATADRGVLDTAAWVNQHEGDLAELFETRERGITTDPAAMVGGVVDLAHEAELDLAPDAEVPFEPDTGLDL